MVDLWLLPRHYHLTFTGTFRRGQEYKEERNATENPRRRDAIMGRGRSAGWIYSILTPYSRMFPQDYIGEFSAPPQSSYQLKYRGFSLASSLRSKTEFRLTAGPRPSLSQICVLSI